MRIIDDLISAILLQIKQTTADVLIFALRIQSNRQSIVNRNTRIFVIVVKIKQNTIDSYVYVLKTKDC